MSYQTRQVLWILLYLALIAASIIAAVVFQRRAGAGKGLLLAGTGTFAAVGFFQLIQTIYYLSTYSQNYYDSPLDELVPLADFLISGIGPMAGIFLLGAAAAKAGSPNPAPTAWATPTAPVGHYQASGYPTNPPPPAPAPAYPPAPPMAPAAPHPAPPVAPLPMSAPAPTAPDGGRPAAQG